MLLIQREKEASVERRITELLRLAVASLGGIVVVSGLLLTARIQMTGVVLFALSAGVLSVVTAAFILARMVVGRESDTAFAYGPDIRSVLRDLREREPTSDQLAESLLEAMPDWLQENDIILARQRRGKFIALSWLASGVLIVLMALVYILGGHILV